MSGWKPFLTWAENTTCHCPPGIFEGLRPYVQVTGPQPGVMAFIAKFHWLVGVMVDYDAVRRIAYENVEDAHKDGIDYIELRFSPWFMAEAHGLDPAGVVEAVVAGITAGQQECGVKVSSNRDLEPDLWSGYRHERIGGAAQPAPRHYRTRPRRVTKPISQQFCSVTISGAPGRQVGILLFMPVKLPDRNPSGRPCKVWALNALGMPCGPSRIQP